MRFVFGFVGKRNIVLILIASFFISMLDLIGIAIILPYMQVLSKKSRTLDYINHVIHGYSRFNPDHFTIIMVFSFSLTLFFVIKFFLSYLINRYQLRSFSDITFKLNNTMFGMLMNSEYGLFVRSSGSEMLGIVNASTEHVTICFKSVTTIANEMIFLVLLTTSLMLVKPLATAIAIAALLMIGAITYLVSINRVSHYGSLQQRLDVDRQKLAFATAGSIKDIKIMELERLFSGRNSELADIYRNITWHYQLLLSMPKIIIEHFFVILFVAGTAAAILLGMDTQLMLPILGMIGLIALRVVPGISKVISAYNSYKYSRISMDRVLGLYHELQENIHAEDDAEASFNACLSIDGINFYYEDHHVLSDVSINIRKGSSIGIVGPSGSGKSTFLDVITGIQKASSGSFKIDGAPIDPFETNVLKKKLGYVPQQIALLDESIAFNITFEHTYDPQRMHDILRISNLQGFVEALPQGVETLVGESGVRLSGGQRQRIGIARALYRDPEILLFDEATSALDNITERELSQEIEKLAGGMTIIQVAHRLSTIEHCDVIYVMDKGKIVAHGTHRDLLQACPLYASMCHDQEAKAD